MPFSLLKLRSAYKNVGRVRQVINVFLKYGFGHIIDQLRLSRFIPIRKRLRAFGQWPAVKGPTIPESLRMAFAELGPSFIKLAQILSSRPDLITSHFADEFKKLQDDVPSFSVEEARKIIEEETHQPISSLFAEFQDEPVAAASIAQVHHGALFDGSDVIIKVQRPDIKEQIETDISILTMIAHLMDKHIYESRFFNPIGIIEEFSRTVRKELDFIEEAKNCLRFRKNFEAVPDVHIPNVYSEFSTERVLVMERVDGVRIDDISSIEAMGLNRKEVARIGTDAYFKMIFEDGFFHADPHPGNIFAMPTGQIGFMDFGIVGRVTDDMKETMANTFLAVINRDFDKLIDQYIEAGFVVSEDVDLALFRKKFKADLTEFLEPFYGMTLKEVNFGRYLDTITHLAMKHNMRIPSDFLLINKAMLILENIGRELDPNFDFTAAAEPYASRLIRERLSPSKLYEKVKTNLEDIGDFAVLFPKHMKQIMRKVLKNDFQVKMFHVNLPEFIKDMDKASNRIAFSMIISAILLSSAIIHSSGIGPKIFNMSIFGFMGFGIAFLLGIWLIISIIRSGRL